MRAVVYDRYAPSAEVLRLVDLPEPEPGPGELLVRVVAVGLNASDWEFLTAKPAYVRGLGGLTKPRRRVLGSDIAGVVEGVGAGVHGFAPGDEVFGDVLGTFGGLSRARGRSRETDAAQAGGALLRGRSHAAPGRVRGLAGAPRRRDP